MRTSPAQTKIKTVLDWLRKYRFVLSTILFLVLTTIFSAVIMLRTFSYRDDTIILGIHVWSDFWANIPLIRSFSYGDNIPPEYPIFPGERIRYHFLFAFMVGMLERIGLRIDIAINLLSIIGMVGFIYAIFWLAKRLTSSHLVGWLAAIFVLFNASLSWVYYIFGKLQLATIQKVITNSEFAAFGPYDDNLISAFWHLNIYANQRHLAFSFFILFLSLFCILYTKKRRWILIGALLIGMLGWLHKAMLLNAFVVLGLMFVLTAGKRRHILASLFLGIAFVIPAIIYLNGDGITTESAVQWRPGFLYNSTSWHEFPDLSNSWVKWLIYWGLNLGLLPIVSFFGWLWSMVELNKSSQKYKATGWKKKIEKYQLLAKLFRLGHRIVTPFTNPQTAWYMSAWAIFIAANLFSFSNDLATNHKLINYSQVIWAIFAGYYLFRLAKTKLFILIIPIFMLLILGGIFDLFPILNQRSYEWPDVQSDGRSIWIMENTKPNAIFLNTSYDTNYITVTGRKIFWGWPYFTWSIGYPTEHRQEQLQPLLLGHLNKQQICEFATQYQIGYLVIDNQTETEPFMDVMVDKQTLHEFFAGSEIEFDQSTIYQLELSCFNEPTAI